jgi:tetratricopeptide (TPR) repeat protein
MGDTYFEKGEYEEAMQFYQRALTLLELYQQTPNKFSDSEYVNKQLSMKVTSLQNVLISSFEEFQKEEKRKSEMCV